MPRLAGILLGLVLAAPAAAQPDPPLADRPPGFSNVVGRYSLEIRAAPTTVRVEEPLLLRVRILGTGPEKGQPRRRDLHLFPPGWDNDFYIEAVPEEDRANPATGTWEFVYRLRPRREDVRALTGLRLVYYNPSRGKYETARQEDDIPLRVEPAAAQEDWDVPAIPAPASFYDLAKLEEVFAPLPGPPLPAWPWLVLLAVAPPLACVSGARFWSARKARQQPSDAAARQALQQLQGSGEPPWLVVGRYLRNRVGYPGEEPTPAEVARFLHRRGAAASVYQAFAAFFAACDTARFAGAGAGATDPLRVEAARLIGALEADRCLA